MYWTWILSLAIATCTEAATSVKRPRSVYDQVRLVQPSFSAVTLQDRVITIESLPNPPHTQDLIRQLDTPLSSITSSEKSAITDNCPLILHLGDDGEPSDTVSSNERYPHSYPASDTDSFQTCPDVDESDVVQDLDEMRVPQNLIRNERGLLDYPGRLHARLDDYDFMLHMCLRLQELIDPVPISELDPELIDFLRFDVQEFLNLRKRLYHTRSVRRRIQ